MSDTERIALGTAQWGMQYGIANLTGPPDDAGVRKILRVATAAGIATLDTAHAYGDAEAMIGRTAKRGSWRIITKLDPGITDAAEAAGAVERVRASLDASRRALRRKRVDAVLLHRAVGRTAFGGAIWRSLLEERRRGRLGRLGVSALDADEALAALDDPTVEIVQVAANLLDRRLARAGVFERAAEAGHEVHVRSVFLQGAALLDAGALPPDLAALGPALESLHAASASLGIDRATLLLGYARDRLPGTIIIGCETAAQLEANLAAWRAAPADIDWDAIEASLPDLPDAVLDPWRWPAAQNASR